MDTQNKRENLQKIAVYCPVCKSKKLRIKDKVSPVFATNYFNVCEICSCSFKILREGV